MHRLLHLPAMLLTAGLFCAGCSHPPGVKSISAAKTSATQSNRVEVSLQLWASTWDGDFPQVTFSQDGESICVWMDQTGWAAPYQIFDHRGSLIATDDGGSLTPVLDGFPEVALRWKCAEFIKGAALGGLHTSCLNSGLSQGFRVVVRDDPVQTVVAEMWKLTQPNRLLWSQVLGVGEDPSGPANTNRASPYTRTVGESSEWASGRVFLIGGDDICMELDARTGAARRKFALGPVESDEKALARAKQLGWKTEDARLLVFSVLSTDYDEARGWIACGSSHDRRVRVVDVSQPSRPIFEAHATDLPVPPKKGDCSTYVKFLSRGAFLMVQSDLSRRRYRREIEIYETATWRKVWETSDVLVHCVSLSPDGKTMAYVRDKTLVICPFGSAGVK